MMRVKMCGTTSVEDAQGAWEAGADFIGLILAESRRRVTPSAAARIVARIPPPAMPVLVFRDQPLDEVAGAVETAGAHWVQLHGSESPEFVRLLHARCHDLHLIRAWEVTPELGARQVRDYLDAVRSTGVPVEVVMLDAPKQGDHPGFERFAAIAGQLADKDVEIWCAGGLTAENLAAALSQGCYRGVDVARGVESSPGVKDHDAVRRFVAEVRRLESVLRQERQ